MRCRRGLCVRYIAATESRAFHKIILCSIAGIILKKTYTEVYNGCMDELVSHGHDTLAIYYICVLFAHMVAAVTYIGYRCSAENRQENVLCRTIAIRKYYTEVTTELPTIRYKEN